MTTQRIPTNTNEAIVAFYNAILITDGQRFTKTDLINYLLPFGFGTAASTVERSLRNLRNSGKVNYSVVNRAQGIFQATPTLALPSQPSQTAEVKSE